ncbi:hypothetical protein HK405_016062, partial [Cladochytrium tenue]
ALPPGDVLALISPEERSAATAAHPLTRIFASVQDGPLARLSEAQHAQLVHYFEDVEAEADAVLWEAGAPADDLYIVQSGELTQTIRSHGRTRVVESLLPGTMVGGLELFAGRRRRTCQLVATEKSRLWRLDSEAFARLRAAQPALALAFVQFCLGFDAFRFANAVARHS